MSASSEPEIAADHTTLAANVASSNHSKSTPVYVKEEMVGDIGSANDSEQPQMKRGLYVFPGPDMRSIDSR